MEDAAAAGIELLPGIGDLEAECSCDAWDHCPHTAALCYQVARLLDEDPFVLLLMRGRDERELLDELQVRSAALASPRDTPRGYGGDPAPVGVRADEAFAGLDVLPSLPAPPPLPGEPGRPPALDTETAPAPGIDVRALEFLAADAAGRAHRLLAEALSDGHERQPVEEELTVGQDAVRMAAAEPDTRIAARLASGSGRERADLALAVRAWRYGGGPRSPYWRRSGRRDRRRSRSPLRALTEAWDEGERPRLRARRNRWTVVGADAQLRCGRDGRWWPYRKERGRWTPAGPGDQDPAAALAVVLLDDGEETQSAG